ncbi:alpha/beta fold hydrolase [Pseudoduganella namucuonensis]|uniref:Pimeloyl-ACP methyl ester carboxylesterase n=1 Tax=Pseudoduganella namucuonensis TaxID=1035707 RepID=A0A1I7LQL6_9BURK|nr:alpha/beta hydrolase [Pseudoduganella namucuonensis]SFV11977.1 Pimeloyl-ACP methyl ester carboxylesterase [Pseudoduganella namucuonensis]
MSDWVLLRGLVREQRHWEAFPDQFRAALPDARVITLDLPGNGTNFRRDSPASVAGMVEACRDELRTRGVLGPVNLLALSLGAMVAVEWRARYPGELECCVLINTSMRPFSRFYERLRWRNYPAILRQLIAGDARSQEALVLRLTSERHAGDAALLDRWTGYQREFPVARRNALRQLFAAARYSAPPDAGAGGAGPGGVSGAAGAGTAGTAGTAGRLLVLAGARDRLVDPCCSRRLARAWGAAFREHPDAGHDLPLDDGPWVAAQVAQWLTPLRGQTPFAADAG